jgi:hypothetical protein
MISGSDARVTSDIDLIFVEVGMFSYPPVLHPLLSLEVRDRKNNRNLLLAEEFVKESVIALKHPRYSASAHAEQQQINTTLRFQFLDKPIGVLDGLKILLNSKLRFLESNGIKNGIGLAAEFDVIFLPLQRTALHAGRCVCYIFSGQKVDDGAFACTRLPKEYDSFSLPNS